MINPPIQHQGQRGKHEKWNSQNLTRAGLFLIFFYCVSSISLAYSAEVSGKTQTVQRPPILLKLSLDDALALFLKQNLELLIGKYGIESSKGRAITAGLFPNPTLTINSLTSYTQACDVARCGAIMGVLTQLFEVAGKRGFRIESAG